MGQRVDRAVATGALLEYLMLDSASCLDAACLSPPARQCDSFRMSKKLAWLALLALSMQVACRGARRSACADGQTWDDVAGNCVTRSPDPIEIVNAATVKVSCTISGRGTVFAMLVPVRYRGEAHRLLAYSSTDGGFVAAKLASSDPLSPYPAKPCTSSGVVFRVAPGDYELQVTRNLPLYTFKNVTKTLLLRANESLELSYGEEDLAQTGMCCHCPFVSVLDPALGKDRPAFEVLRGRASPETAGTDRIPIRVPVRAGRFVLRIRELEYEVTHLEGLALETKAGVRIEPTVAAPRLLRRGEEATLTFDSAALGPDGETAVTLLVSGHYELESM